MLAPYSSTQRHGISGVGFRTRISHLAGLMRVEGVYGSKARIWRCVTFAGVA